MAASMIEMMSVDWEVTMAELYLPRDNTPVGSEIKIVVLDSQKDAFLAEIVDLYNAVKGDKEGIE